VPRVTVNLAGLDHVLVTNIAWHGGSAGGYAGGVGAKNSHAIDPRLALAASHAAMQRPIEQP
jgi:hypothetical protein